MRIIGKTENGFILEASRKELSNLTGYYSEFADSTSKLKVGQLIKVSEMYDQLYTLASKTDTISSISKKLAELIGELQIINPIIKELLPTDKGVD